METVKDYNKFKSRTFWIVISWMGFIPLAIISQLLVASYDITIPINTIATGAATATALFLGGEKIAKVFREKNESNA